MNIDLVLGQEHITEGIKAAIVKDKLPKVLVLGGISGNGKTFLSKMLARDLESEHDYTEVQYLNADGISHVIDLAFYQSSDPYRVIVLNEAERATQTSLSEVAAVARTMPDNVVIIVHTTKDVPAALANQGLSFEFKRIVPSQIMIILKQRYPDAEAKMLLAVILQCGGNIKECFKLMSIVSAFKITTLDDFQKDFGKYNAALYILQHLRDNEYDQIEQYLTRFPNQVMSTFTDMQEVVADVIAIKAKVKPQCLDFQVEERTTLAQSLTTSQVNSALKLLWAAINRMDKATDKREELLIVCYLINDVWNAGKTKPQKKSIIEVDTPMTFAQLQEMASNLID